MNTHMPWLAFSPDRKLRRFAQQTFTNSSLSSSLPGPGNTDINFTQTSLKGLIDVGWAGCCNAAQLTAERAADHPADGSGPQGRSSPGNNGGHVEGCSPCGEQEIIWVSWPGDQRTEGLAYFGNWECLAEFWGL